MGDNNIPGRHDMSLEEADLVMDRIFNLFNHVMPQFTIDDQTIWVHGLRNGLALGIADPPDAEYLLEAIKVMVVNTAPALTTLEQMTETELAVMQRLIAKHWLDIRPTYIPN